MRNLFAIIFLLAFLPPLMAEEEETVNEAPRHEVKGVVTDERGEPLPGASVWVKGTMVGAGTDVNGRFAFKLSTTERCVVRVSFTGYRAEERTVTPGADTLYRFQLRPSDNPLEEVVVTSLRAPKPLKEVPVVTRVVSRADIERLNPLDLQSLLEYSMPGLQFGIAHGSGLPELKYQGSTGGYVLFMVDGERVAGEGSSNNIDYNLVDVDNVERVEIVKGPMSTLYGSQAMGGVVNIITRDANRPFSGNASVRQGTNDEGKYSLSLGTKQGRFSSMTTGSYRKREAYAVEDEEGQITLTHYKDTHGRDSVVADTSTLGMTSVKGFEIWQASEKLSFTFNERLRASVKGSYYHNKVLDYAAGKTWDEFSNYSVNPQVSHSINENHYLSLTYLYENYVKREKNEAGKNDKVFGDQTNTARVEYTGQLGERHLFIAGAELNTQRLRHYWFGNGTGRVYEAQNYAVYAQEDWRASERLNVVAGVRGNIHSKYGFHASPSVSAMWRVGVLSLRGGYGMGFRIPSLKELHSEYDMGDNGWFLILGNEDLEPETSHQGTLSAEVTKGALNATVSGYYTYYENEIALGAAPDGKNQQYYNAKHANRTGLDATAQLRLDNGLTLNASYAYVNANSKVDGYNMASDRPHSMTFSANYVKAIRRVTVSATLSGWWMSSVETWHKNEAGGYAREKYDGRTFCKLNVTGKFPRGIRFSADIDNLFDFHDKNVTADQSVTPQRGIGFIGTLSVNLGDLFQL